MCALDRQVLCDLRESASELGSVTGMLFPPDDDEELARLLAALARDKARLRALSKGALAQARRYDFPSFARELDRVVTEVSQEAAVLH